jgi:hypothetical protein
MLSRHLAISSEMDFAPCSGGITPVTAPCRSMHSSTKSASDLAISWLMRGDDVLGRAARQPAWRTIQRQGQILRPNSLTEAQLAAALLIGALVCFALRGVEGAKGAVYRENVGAVEALVALEGLVNLGVAVPCKDADIPLRDDRGEQARDSRSR